MSSGIGYCDNDTVRFSTNRLSIYSETVEDRYTCSGYAVKYDSTNKRLVTDTRAYTCYGYIG
jgi:hypothetical protein